MNIDHHLVVNLEQSLHKEFLRSNRAGAFASSSLIFCNTRKHHGLLICPLDEKGKENHVLLSALDETLLFDQQEFHLGIHKYPGTYHPLGHKYIEVVGADPSPYVVYRIGGVTLKKELMLVEQHDQILIQYTVLESPETFRFRLQPFLAFRNIYGLTRENMFANTRYESVDNGVRFRLYEPYPYLYLQLSKAADYIHAPQWHQNIEYIEDQTAGEPYQEDLFVPGYFELKLKQGDSFVLSGSTEDSPANQLKKRFSAELKKRIPRNTFFNCLSNAAEQFLRRRGERVDIVAGFPTFGTSGRDALLSLPGLTIYRNGDETTYFEVLDTLLTDLQSPDPFLRLGNHIGKRAADTPLLFIWALQQYVVYKDSYAGIWKKYGAAIETILNHYAKAQDPYIRMHDNGLVWAEQPGLALTWMDVVLDNHVITPRAGYPVEINAFWYNALRFAAEAAGKANKKESKETWQNLAERVAHSFVNTFWSAERKYLADYVHHTADWRIRPNMLFAASLPFSPLSSEQRLHVLETVHANLYTKKGLRTASPHDPHYVGMPSEIRKEARRVYHQGNIFPWLTGHFFEGLFRLRGKAMVAMAEQFYHEFEKEMTRKGMGAISEYFHGNPPHEGRGAISQAWNTAELLRLRYIIDQYTKQ